MTRAIVNTMFVKPSLGKTVRDPEQQGAILAECGETKPRSTYWLRRIASGDCIEVKPPARVPRAKNLETLSDIEVPS